MIDNNKLNVGAVYFLVPVGIMLMAHLKPTSLADWYLSRYLREAGCNQ